MYKKGNNIHELWETFKVELLKQCIPSRNIKSKHSVPWLKHRERKLLKKKQRLYRQAKKTKKWTNYRQFQKECKRTLRRAEWDYINTNILEGLNNNSTKPFWKYIKSKKQDSFGIAPLKSGNKMVSDSKSKANILVKQFQSVFTIDKPGELPKTSKTAKHKIPPIKIKTEGVQKLLAHVNPSKASGPDNIPNRILKECANQLAPSLSIIFQLSIDSGELPKDWREANISCIFKKGDKHLAENYRPVSLTSVPVMEYGSTIWDPYQKGDIIKLERIQRKAIRFIKHDYRTREEGCINKIGSRIRPSNKNVYDWYYSTRWLRGWCRHYLLTNSFQNNDQGEPLNPKHSRTATQQIFWTDKCALCNNTKNLTVIRGNTQKYNSSFFIQTIVDWNHLDEEVVSAKSVEAFKTALVGLSKYD